MHKPLLNTNVSRSILSHDLSSFIKQSFITVNPGASYLHNWHIDLIAEYLRACESGQIKRLIINIPPRSLKSISVTVAWPAWLLGHDPNRRVIAASYSQKLSNKHSLDSKLVVNSPWYQQLFCGTRLKVGESEKAKFVTTKQGFRLATSVGGTLTGEGGDFLILDDPHKPNDVFSDVRRENVLHWFDQTFASRLDDKSKGVMVLIMQRLHEQDLTGYLLEKGGWEHVCLPMESDEKQVFDMGNKRFVRGSGEFLQRVAELTALKRDLGSFGFSAQYQQKPVPTEGGMIKSHWFCRYNKLGEYKRIIQSWDTAVKIATHNDYSVCTTWGETEEGYYLLDVLHDKLEYPRLKQALKVEAEKWNADVILLEDKASGQSLLQDMRRESLLTLIAINPISDKVTRVAAISAMIEAGKVWLPHDAVWLAGFLHEVTSFPKTKHDDRVDSMSQFLNWARGKKRDRLRVRGL